MQFCQLKRREFITILGGATALIGSLLGTQGEQRPVPVIGMLWPNSRDAEPDRTFLAAFLEGLRDGGFVEGRNVAIEYRWAEGRNDRLSALAADLVRRHVNVIVPAGGPAARVAKAATTTIPIVFQAGGDPIQSGLVANLNRPGGNITGISNSTVTLAAKRLDLLHKLTPKTATIGVLIDPTTPGADAQRTNLRETANGLGLQLIFLNASSEQEIDAAFATLVQQRIGALILVDTPFFNGRRDQLVTLARFNAIPTMYTFREFAAAGGLISHASSITDALRKTGIYVARILKGEKPGDLPVQLPTKFDLVINLKAAKAPGIEVPPTLLATADEVME
jgi:putative ABC transport system substrate-binding protein